MILVHSVTEVRFPIQGWTDTSEVSLTFTEAHPGTQAEGIQSPWKASQRVWGVYGETSHPGIPVRSALTGLVYSWYKTIHCLLTFTGSSPDQQSEPCKSLWGIPTEWQSALINGWCPHINSNYHNWQLALKLKATAFSEPLISSKDTAISLSEQISPHPTVQCFMTPGSCLQS